MSIFVITAVKAVFQPLAKLLCLGMKREHAITRFRMYQRLAQVVPPAAADAKVLAISGSKTLASVLQLDRCEVVETHYPEIDLLNLPYSDSEFDYVISDQVLEHVKGNPQQAIDESYRVLKPGGLAIHTTCFFNPIHEEPIDFWRFTPKALRYLCRNFDKVIEWGGWGNRYAWLWIAVGLRYEGIPEVPWHPLYKLAVYNEANVPISTWVVARK